MLRSGRRLGPVAMQEWIGPARCVNTSGPRPAPCQWKRTCQPCLKLCHPPAPQRSNSSVPMAAPNASPTSSCPTGSRSRTTDSPPTTTADPAGTTGTQAGAPDMAIKRPGAYVPLAVNYADDEAIMDAGEDAELMYLRILAFCGRTPKTEGWISDKQIRTRLGLELRPEIGPET